MVGGKMRDARHSSKKHRRRLFSRGASGQLGGDRVDERPAPAAQAQGGVIGEFGKAFFRQLRGAARGPAGSSRSSRDARIGAQQQGDPLEPQRFVVERLGFPHGVPDRVDHLDVAGGIRDIPRPGLADGRDRRGTEAEVVFALPVAEVVDRAVARAGVVRCFVVLVTGGPQNLACDLEALVAQCRDRPGPFPDAVGRRTPCPPRRSGCRRKCDRVAARWFAARSSSTTEPIDRAPRTSGRC
jgi:hypothetical protein